jgi:hypothetical protein
MQPPAPKRLKSGASFTLIDADDDDSDDEVLDAPATKSCEDEISAYQRYKHKVTEHSCPLEWYKAEKDNFPCLSYLARFFFCTTATSIPSECCFSDSGAMQTDKRNRMTGYLTEFIMILKRNQHIFLTLMH